MIDLYAMGSPNVVKIYIALEEMGLPYTVHPVDVFGEEQFKPLCAWAGARTLGRIWYGERERSNNRHAAQEMLHVT